MLEWLAVSTGVELGKLVLDQVLDLSKPVLEGYVEDFFKDCLDSGVARLKASQLKPAMATAIGVFIQRFIKELQFNDVPDTSIDHHYRAALKRFVRDQAVRPLLGKAFEMGCKKLNHSQLQEVWTNHYQQSGWQFPAEEFDWQGVTKEYILAVKGIIKADAELRGILESDLLEAIAHNTTQLSPGFDVTTYRKSLQASYGYLKLYTLDSTDGTDAVRLWRMFIEPRVREALPPTRYDLPLDLKRQLLDAGDLETDLSPAALASYRREYFQQPARKVLEVVAGVQHAVILGDPGSGKSMLLQFLALDWVEGKTEALPLLIELREYALAQSTGFLNFLHSGSGANWQFDQQQLHQYLLENPTLVMFDGLDEVFDRPTQATIIDDIIRFAQCYPQARVIVTSRIIGYNLERFQHAGFRQFTIQALDETETCEFIDRWYDLSMGDDPDKVRLKQRLKEAIANSKAIQNLADNPLLLTMMAILNRRQELPRDRADLYDQASRVLLYHWDVDHKRLNLPLDAIGRREKQEILRLIAYEMQAGEEGLKGNLIHADRLIHILTHYLRDQGFSDPREKANILIRQLQERNFILCYRGADTYGFMHRTFLEYFCAIEIVHRFEKKRTLTFEQLRDEIFGQHWQDETWDETLRLTCGLLDVKITQTLIDSLINKNLCRNEFLKDSAWEKVQRLEPGGLRNIILAVDCFLEIFQPLQASETLEKLLAKLKDEIQKRDVLLNQKTAEKILTQIAHLSSEALPWLQQQAREHHDGLIQQVAVSIIVENYQHNLEILPWLKSQIFQEFDSNLHLSSIYCLAKYYRDHPETLTILKEQISRERSWICRFSASNSLSEFYGDKYDIFPLLVKRVTQDKEWLVRYSALEGIASAFPLQPQSFDLFCSVVQEDPFIQTEFYDQRSPRFSALKALVKHYHAHRKTRYFLQRIANEDPNKKMQVWAQEQIEKLGIQNSEFKMEGA